MARGTPEQFHIILSQLVSLTKQYEARQINHVKFFDNLDILFTPTQYGWSKQEFHKELNAQLGITHNERKEPKPTLKPKAKRKATKKKKVDEDLPF
jgi:hypothetical protein